MKQKTIVEMLDELEKELGNYDAIIQVKDGKKRIRKVYI